jgi:hypothetical protein
MTEVKGSINFLKRLKKEQKTKVVDLDKTMLNDDANYNNNNNKNTNTNTNNNNDDLNIIISPTSSAPSSTSSSTSTSSYLVPIPFNNGDLNGPSSTPSTTSNTTASTSSSSSNPQMISVGSLVSTSQVIGGSVTSLSRSLSSRSIESSSSQTKIDGKENMTDANLNRKILIKPNHQHKQPSNTNTPNNNNNNNIKYGELIVLGHNGYIKNSDSNSNKINCASSRRKSKFSLKIREKPNGVKPCSQHNFQNNQEANVCRVLFILSIKFLHKIPFY